jgi:hypothetical protein
MRSLLLFLCSSFAFAQNCSSIPPGFSLAANGGRLNGFVPFPASSYWHRDIAGTAADSNSANYISDVRQGGDRRVLSAYAGNSGGYTYHVVSGAQPRVNVYFDVPQAVVQFTNGSTAVTWLSGAYLNDPYNGMGGAGATLGVYDNVGSWADGAATNYVISSVGGCTAQCTTAVLTSAYTGPTGNHAINGQSIPSQSDSGPIPLPPNPGVSGTMTIDNPFPAYTNYTDAVTIVVDKDNCVLYETSGSYYDGRNMHVIQMSVFDLLGGDNQRPYMWTSTSVSGLPQLPGLLRDEEISGAVPINHPILVTLGVMAGSGNFYPKHSWIAPAEHHQYGFAFNPWWHPANIPFGALMRLVPGFDTSSYPPQAQLIMAAMKRYGVIFIDGGNTMDLRVTAGWNWDTSSTQAMYSNFAVTSSDFEVITGGNSVYCDPIYATAGYNGGNTPLCPHSTNNLAGSLPVIFTFTASSTTVTAGTPVTLEWTTSGSSTGLVSVSPNIGIIRGTNGSVATFVRKTTTYTLRLWNQYGITTRNVTVTAI